jgi:RHS repeat-associated core domain
LNQKVFAPLHDLQGNLTALIPIDGSKPSFYRYSAFGEEKNYGPTLSPWRFSSKRSDAETKLVYYGRRFYMPYLGRWLTPDPAGFTDGMNLYGFVHNEPLLHFDVYGLWLEPRPPGSFDSSTILRGWGNDAMATWNNPRFQGGMQAFCGMAEASIGAPLMFTPFAPFGAALMIHGADHFVAGTRSMVTGRQIPTASEMLLQKMGMTPGGATFTNNLLSMGGAFGGINMIRQLTYQASGLLAQRGMSSLEISASRPATSSVSRHLLRNKLIAEEISGGHAFEKHVLNQGEFSGWIRTKNQLSQHIEKVINNPTEIKKLRGNRMAYWHQETGTVVIHNSRALDGGTVFQPKNGYEYFVKEIN